MKNQNNNVVNGYEFFFYYNFLKYEFLSVSLHFLHLTRRWNFHRRKWAKNIYCLMMFFIFSRPNKTIDELTCCENYN